MCIYSCAYSIKKEFLFQQRFLVVCSDLSGGYGIVTSLGFVEKLLILFCGNNGKGFCSCFDVFLVTIQLRSCFCLEWTFITFPPAFLFFCAGWF